MDRENRADIAIIGTGPAGLSAAINAKIRKKKFLLFGSPDLSRKVEISQRLDNYPGLMQITGKELNQTYKEQLQAMDISIENARITGIYDMGGYFCLSTGQQEYEALTVILATGNETVKPLPGEREYLGRGVSYCATCDGNLYKGRTIAVVCDNEEMEEEAVYLSELAQTVHYFPIYKSSLTGSNIIRHDSAVKAVHGGEMVNHIVLQNGKELAVDGVFFLKNAVAADVLLHGLETKDGHIVVDRSMATNIKGCYAAGDCTGRPYQIAKAVGEGNVALHSAISYLAKAT